jgi:hypothetical protein
VHLELSEVCPEHLEQRDRRARDDVGGPRRPSPIIAISPKKSPGPSDAMTSPPWTTSAVPSSITKNS